MAIVNAPQWKIFRILAFKRGQDIGSIKIIAKTDSKAFSIARELIAQSEKYNMAQIRFRLLELQTLPHKGQLERVLSREGV